MTSRGRRHGVRVSWQPMRDDEELGLFASLQKVALLKCCGLPLRNWKPS